MGAPYSLDLRKRVVATIKGRMPRNKAAQQFGPRSARPSMGANREEKTGSVEPVQIGGHRPKALSGLQHRIRESDFTLRGSRSRLAGRGLWEFVHAPRNSASKKQGGWRTRSF
jgi:transposase